MRKILSLVGNREQAIKQALLNKALHKGERSSRLSWVSVDTGGHCEAVRTDPFLRGLAVDPPQYDLAVVSDSALSQMNALSGPLHDLLMSERPDAVVLFGGATSALVGALVATHLEIPCVHADAGGRTYRRAGAPEEANSIVVDQLSRLVLAHSRTAERHLRREGFGKDRAHFVGDLMLDHFNQAMAEIEGKAGVEPAHFGAEPSRYIFAPLPDAKDLEERRMLIALAKALDAAPMPALLPLYPPLDRLFAQSGWQPTGMLRLVEPPDHFDYLRLLRDSAVVVSDSIAVARDALFAGKDTIVPRDECWWPESLESGLALAVGQDLEQLNEALERSWPARDDCALVVREFGDGNAAGHIAEEIVEMLDASDAAPGRDGAWHRLGYRDEIPPATERRAFSYDAYRELVREVRRAGYAFVSFEGVIDSPPATPYCLMRHDIDFDLAAARDLARVEAAEDVAATYFFMVRTNHYNLFSDTATQLTREILGLGHHLGLHFDAASYPGLSEPAAFREAVTREVDMLERWFDLPVSAVSFHRPSAFVLEGDPSLAAPRVHTYDRRLQKAAEYVADSGGNWKHGTPLTRDAFRLRRPLHILTHPIWWAEVPASPFEMLSRLIDDRRDRDDESFAVNCRPYRVGRLARCMEFVD